jgi:hypothetical protein
VTQPDRVFEPPTTSPNEPPLNAPTEALAHAAIVALALIMAWLTWGHWGDIQIDCGRELYVPMEVLRGKLVYRDFWYSYGPLTPYVEAVLVAAFGPHFYVFFWFGLAITVGCALLLFDLGTMLDGTAIGFTAAFGLILQSFEPWQFNFIFPYAYAATFGLMLGLLSASFAIRYILRRNRFALTLAGLAAALALLCKQEVGLACYLMLASVIAIETLTHRSPRLLFASLVESIPGVALAAGVYGWFFWKLTFGFVLENWIGPQGPYFAAKYGKQLNADFGMRFHPLEIIGLLVCAALALRLWYWLARLCLSRNGILWLLLIALTPMACRIATSSHPWSDSLGWHLLTVLYGILVYPRGMYFITLGLLIYTCYLLYLSPGEPGQLATIAFCIFAAALAIRVLSQVTAFGYSIYYGSPLFLTFLLAVDGVIGSRRGKAVWRGWTVRSVLLAVEIVALAALVFPGKDWRTAKLPTSWGSIYLSPNDASVASRMLDFIADQKRLGHRVAVMPEAPIMYALTDTEAPGRWYTLLPGFLSASEEQAYIAELDRIRPEYLFVTGRSFTEYGSPHFGIDFDREIYRWIETNYSPVDQYGEFPTGSRQALAAKLYRRRSSR